VPWTFIDGAQNLFVGHLRYLLGEIGIVTRTPRGPIVALVAIHARHLVPVEDALPRAIDPRRRDLCPTGAAHRQDEYEAGKPEPTRS